VSLTFRKPNSITPERNSTIISTTLFFLLISLIIIIIVLASVPPTSRDALTHHLYIPKLYLQHGGIYEIPAIVFSYFPMNLDMLYMIPLGLGNDIAPKYIHFSFAFFTALLIFFYLTKRLNYIWGLLCSLFFLSVPIITKLSITAYVDLGLIFFSTAALLLLFKWLENTSKLSPLCLSALCCGLGLGTKYNGLITLFLLTAFIPILYSKTQLDDQKRTGSMGLFYGALFMLISLLAYSPWGLRNFLWTNNPFYPLFSGADTAVMGGMNQFVLRKFLYNEKWWQTLLIPIRIFFEGRDNSPQFFDGQLNPFLLLLPPLAFILIKVKASAVHREKMALLFFSILFLLIAFFKRELRIRYIGPIIPPLVMLSIFTLSNLYKYATQQKKVFFRCFLSLATFGVIVTMLLFNANYLLQQIHTINPISYLTGKESRSQYITRFRPEYPTIEYANQHLTNNAKLLCIFLGNRGYYINNNHTFDFQNGISSLCSIAQQAKKSIDILNELNKRQFTHLLVHEDLWQNWIKRNLSQNQLSILMDFMQTNTTILYHNDGYTLYKISKQ